MRSGHQSPAGSLTSLYKHPTPAILVFLAVLALGLLFLMPGGLLQAQSDGMIDYAENGMDAVATFTATDPEDRMVYWSLAPAESDPDDTAGDLTIEDAADAAEFSISSDGVLSFRFSPDYETPRGEAKTDENTNTYKVVVVAADEPLGATNRVLGYKEVTVNVTDVDEQGVITLGAQQPQENRALTATLIDDDASTDQNTAAKWKWEHSESKGGPWTAILTATSAAYTPLGVADKYLRATATYTDGHGADKNAQVVSPHMVRAEPAANNAAPVFPDEDTTDDAIDVGRKVNENSPPGTRVGEPVVTNDALGDVPTYTLTDESNFFDIDPATGQITVAHRAMLDADGDNASYTVMVTATDPWGPSADQSGAMMQPVIITINNVNEAPVITDGDTNQEVVENTLPATVIGDIYAAYPEVSTTPCDTAAGNCTWSLEGADAGDFNIGNQTGGTLGQLTFKEAPNYEMPADANKDNMYMVTVVVTDAGIDGMGKLSAERDVVVTVTNVNEPIAADADNNPVTLSSLVPKVGVALTATLSDPDGGEKDIEWQWSITGAMDLALRPNGEISGAESDTYTPKADDVGGILTVMVDYADAVGSGRIGTALAVNAVVPDLAAKAPVFKPKPASRSVPENYATAEDTGYPNVGAVVTATDPNGATDILTYSLGGTDAGSFSIDQETGQIMVKTATKLDREAKATYMVTVTATDPGGLSDSVNVTIKLTDEDEGPEIAGDDVSRDYPENGTGSVATLRATDPEGRRPVYWSLLATGTPGDITADDYAEQDHFSISANGVLSFKFAPDYEAPPSTNADANNTYRVVVVAADEPQGAGNRELGYKEVTVNVTNVEENETVTLSLRQAQVGTAVTATYNDSDNERPDGTNLTWKWYLGGAEIPGASTATFTPTSSGSHRVEASYTKTDGSKKAASATITVRAEPTTPQVSPLFSLGSDQRSVDENSSPDTKVGSAVTATDPGDVLTYMLTDTSNSFDINPATGQITVGARTTLDFETTPTYTVTVTATDPWGPSATPNGAMTQLVTITINNVNEVPVITVGDTEASVVEPTDDATPQAGATYAAYPEASDTLCAGTTCTWSLKGPDAGDFEISNADSDRGQLTFKEVPNYEMPADANGDNVYMVTVVVTDAGIDGKGKLSAERDVVVTVTNVNEPIAADADNNPVTLSSLVPKVGVALTATLSDPDGGEKDIEWQWSITGAMDLALRPNGEISGAESDTYTPKADDVGGILTVMVDYADAVGSGRIGTALAVNAVVADTAAKAPVFKPKPASRSVLENYATGDMGYPDVGAVVMATDPNGDVLTYSLGGTDAGSFSIDQRTGQIKVKTATKLDLEAKATYMVTVTATDPGGLTDSVDVTIKLTDEDEAPMIERGGLAISGMSSVDYAENRMDTVAEYTLAGPMKGRARWSLEGDDASDFTLMNGTLKFKRTPNYEMRMDSDTDNVYMVTVKAMDGTYTAMKPVTVTVTNVDEIGTLSGPEIISNYMEDSEDTVGIYTVSGGSMSEMANLTLMGDDAGDFRIMDDGMLTFRSSPDYENPMDMGMDNMYQVTVKAEAGGETEMRPVTVTVTNKEEPGEVTLSAMQPVVGEAVTATLMDPDGGEMDVTWKWARSMDMNTWMDIAGATDAAYAVMDDDAGYYLRATAMYSDGEGMGKMASEETMMVMMVTMNASPMFNSEVGTREVAENTAAGMDIGDPVTATDAEDDTLTYALGGTDAASFGIGTATGHLTTKEDLDYETKDSYEVTVTATDPDSASDMITVTITVTNVEEPGEVTLSAMQPVVGEAVTATLMDLDGGEMDVTWKWARSMDMSDWTDIMDANDAMYTPMAIDDGYYLRATAMYTDGEGPDKSAMGDSENMVTSLAISGMSSVYYAEKGMDAVETYTAAGPEAEMASWTLEGDDAGAFSISNDGMLTFMNSPDYENPMDADTDNTYMATVMANDGTNDAMIEVTVMVTNEEEMGEVTLWDGADALTMAPQVGDTITGAVMDPDGGEMVESWQWSRTMTPDMMDSWMDIQDATDAPYMVTAGDEGYHLRVMATYTDAVGTDTAMGHSMPTMMVTAVDEEMTLLERYDTNNNGIEKSEVLVAIDDFLFGAPGVIEKEDVLTLIDLFLFGDGG